MKLTTICLCMRACPNVFNFFCLFNVYNLTFFFSISSSHYSIRINCDKMKCIYLLYSEESTNWAMSKRKKDVFS